jgi:hypothetical protein
MKRVVCLLTVDATLRVSRMTPFLRRYSAIAAVIPLAAGGCTDWPQYAERDTDALGVPSTTDPRSLFEIAWTEFAEDASGDFALETTSLADAVADLALDGGLRLRGQWTGSGWDPAITAPAVEDPACASRGRWSPGEKGFYTGDIDAIAFDAPAAALCVRALVPDGAFFGWDLLVFPVDACGVPGAPLADANQAIYGLDRGGISYGYGVVVPSGRYVVQWASYDPDDPGAVLGYEVGISAVRPDADGGIDLCPLLPGELLE